MCPNLINVAGLICIPAISPPLVFQHFVQDDALYTTTMRLAEHPRCRHPDNLYIGCP
jgi:hypothetical protein